MTTLLDVKLRHSQSLFEIPGVFGVGIKDNSILVLLYDYYHGKKINKETVPEEIEGIKVTVIQDNNE